MNDYISDVFGAGGLFASRFPGYEMREGQVALARVVDEAMQSGRHCLGEGPCGVGKGVAYCVPAIHQAHCHGKRTVVVTANIALQEQLLRKDLPMLAEVIPWEFSFALLKGRNNYACLNRIEDSDAQGELQGLFDRDQQKQTDDVLAWLNTTKTGDVSELSFVPTPSVWSRFSVGSDECKHDGCEFRQDCFAQHAHDVAQEADIVVTNYHMLFAHLAVRKETCQDLVLPAFDLLVLDEAHEAAGIAREFFGFTVSEYTFVRLATTAQDLGDKALAKLICTEAERLFGELTRHAQSPQYRRRLKCPGVASSTGLQRAISSLVVYASNRSNDPRLSNEERFELGNVVRRARRAITRLGEGLEQSDSGKVYWLELDARGRARLHAKPVDVGGLLREELFGRCSSISLVSATLTACGTFDFVRRELGVPDGALEVIAETPFDFKSQALLVVPDGLPEPREPEFVEVAAGVFRQVLEMCNGRTLGLFTSYRNLNAVYDRLAGTRHRILRQGELPRAELTRIFKEDVGSVLFGTDSFWTGIDVPGEALTAVVIDKLPFPRPDDPVIDAICERDPRAFDNFLVPLAIIALRQGVGRLIRCKTDVGVVVILDRRIADKAYGHKFISSLPPMLNTRQIGNITRFLSDAALSTAS